MGIFVDIVSGAFFSTLNQTLKREYWRISKSASECRDTGILTKRMTVVGMATRFALSRETKLRAEIADELEWVKASPTNFIDLCKSLEGYIEKLRGNK